MQSSDIAIANLEMKLKLGLKVDEAINSLNRINFIEIMSLKDFSAPMLDIFMATMCVLKKEQTERRARMESHNQHKFFNELKDVKT